MFGNNAFGALAMDQGSSSSAGPSLVQVEGDEVEAEWLSLSKTNGEVYVKVQDPVDLSDLPSECNLMAISNKWGLVAVGGQTDVRIHRLKDLHRLFEDSPKDALPVSTPVTTIPLQARPIWIRFAMNDERLVIGLKDGAGVANFKLADVVSGSIQPYHTFNPQMPGNLLDLLPNPAPSSPLVALVGRTGIVIADIESRSLRPPISGEFTCGCWSAKGKQIVVGTSSGRLAQYTPEGTLKAEIPPPPELDDPHVPSAVQWLENDLFLVYYARHDAEPEDPLECFVISRTKDSITYTKFFDIMDSFGVAGRSGRYRHFATLKNWGSSTKHLAFVVSGLATEIVVIHGASDGANSKWELVTLGETARGVLPAAKKGMSDDDTSVLALDIDLTVEKPVERGIVGGEELPSLPPPPRLLAYSQSGFLISFNIVNADGGQYPGRIVPSDISSASATDRVDVGSIPQTSAASESAKPAFGGFGSTAPTAFGSTTPTSTPAKPAFGSSGSGQTSQSAFGSTPTPFGSTTPSAAPSKPAFGQSGFGGFDTSATTAASTSAFGQSTTPSQPAFGSSAFGQSSKPAFGSSGFGSTSTSSAFGQSGFGKPASASSAAPASGSTGFAGFGQSAQGSSGSAFGQSAFGQSAKPESSSSIFGQSQSGEQTNPTGKSASPFGQTTFGQPAKPSQPSFGFGNTSSAGSSAFGAKPAATGFGFGASTFGQKTEPKDEAKATGGSTNLFSPASFGSGGSGGFGQSTFGATSSPSPSSENKSPFGGFGQKSAPAPSPFGSSEVKDKDSSAANAEKDDFGMGGFAAILGDSAKPAGPAGLGDSPPGSPVLQGGKAGQVPGLDDSPPNSPPPLPKQSAPSASLTPSSASAFIKPATAFSGASTGAFGNFSTNKQQGSAFPSSTPAAFSSPAPSSKGANGASPGGSAFGQASKPAAPAFGTSAFGQPLKPEPSLGSAFGQSSKPRGFGQPSTPAPAFGTISGGFGGFAQKTGATSPLSSGGFAGFGAKSSGTAGFGGFAGQSSGASIFGEKQKAEAPKSLETSAFPSAQSKTEEPAKVVNVKAERPPTPQGYDVPEPPRPPTDAIKKETDETENIETKENIPVVPEFAVQPQEPEVTRPSIIDTATAATVSLPAADTPGEEKAEQEIKKEATEEGQEDHVKETEEKVKDEADDEAEAGVSERSADRDDELVFVEHNEASADMSGDGDAAGDEEYDENDDYDDEDDYEDDEGNEGQTYDEDGSDSEGYDDDSENGENSEGGSVEQASRGTDSGDAEEGLEDDRSQSEEEDEDVSVKPARKSPPAWFTTVSEAGTQASISAGGEEKGFSFGGAVPQDSKPPAALQPIAAAQKLPASFNLKHAVRTSSPLGQPPQMASTSPEGTPAKTSGFSFFNQDKDKPAAPAFGTGKSGTPFGLGLGRPPVQGASATAQAGPPSLFSGFGNSVQPTAASSGTQTPGKDAAPKSAFTGFGQTSSAFGSQPDPSSEQKPSQPGSLFAGFGPKKDEQTSAGPPPLFAGFGQPKSTDTPAASAPQPASLFGSITSSSATDGAETQKSQAASPFAGFSQVSSSKPTPAPLTGLGQKADPTPAIAPSSSVKNKFEPTARVSVPMPQQPADDGNKTMSAVLERMITNLLAELQHLKDTLTSNGNYHQQFNDRSLPPITFDNINEHTDLPFSSLGQTTEIIRILETRLKDLQSVESGIEANVANIQSSLMKTDVKVGQAEKFLEARADGSFSRALKQVNELNPEQAEHQTRLRKLTETVESTLIDLEDGIAKLKKGLDDAQPSLPSEGSPSVGRIHKGVRKVDAGIRDRAAAIEDLADRIASLRVATPPRRRQPIQPIAEKKAFEGVIPLVLEPSSGVIEAVERGQERRAAMRARFGSKSGGVAKVTKVDLSVRPGSAPMCISTVPVPGHSTTGAPTQIQSLQSTNGTLATAKKDSPASSGFGSFFTPQKPTGQAGAANSFAFFGAQAAK